MVHPCDCIAGGRLGYRANCTDIDPRLLAAITAATQHAFGATSRPGPAGRGAGALSGWGRAG